MLRDPFLQFLARPSRERYTQFVIAYLPAVERLVKRLLVSGDLVKDMVQETFVELGRKRTSPGKVRQPRSYVLGVAFHLCQRSLERVTVRARNEQEASRRRPTTAPSTLDRVVARESVAQLHEAIDSLPEILRAAMHLHAIEGLSYREIAAITGSTGKAVSMRLARARKLLRSQLGDAPFLVAIGALRDQGPRAYFLESSDRAAEVAVRISQGRWIRTNTAAAAKTPLTIGVGIVALGIALLLIHRAGALPRSQLDRQVMLAKDAPVRQFAAAPRRKEPTSSSMKTGPPSSQTPETGSPSIPEQIAASTPIAERASEAPSQKGNDPMRFRALTIAPILLALQNPLPIQGVETGDVDGDGRLSIRDVVNMMEGLEPTPGSMDGFTNDPDLANLPNELSELWKRGFYAGTTYLELLRRSVPDPLPHWMNLTAAWNLPVAQPPLPTDRRVSISLEGVSVRGGLDDRVEMKLHLQTTAGLRGFLILLENAESVLRIPSDSGNGQSSGGWHNLIDFELGNRTSLGDLPFAAPTASFLITNGRYVIQYGLFRDGNFSRAIEPGEFDLIIPVRLPRGTPAGKYHVKILESSQVLLESNEVFAPTMGAPAELTIESAINAGWDEGVPPLNIDPQERRVLGQIRFRLANENGEAPADGEPVAIGNPGEDVSVRVQMRTEVPLNTISYRLHWASEHLRCTEYGPNDVKILFTNPENGETYLPRFPNQIDCEKAGSLGPNHEADFHVGADTDDSHQNYKDRPLEYFKPLGEWRDLTEVKLHISGCAEPAEEIPLTFRRYSVGDGNSLSGLFCSPFGIHRIWDFRSPNWSYDFDYQDGFIQVGEGPPRCPEDRPDPGVRFLLGNVTGSPGQEVEVPIQCSADIHCEELRLALESDPSEVVVESVEMDVVSLGSGETVELSANRGEQAYLEECDNAGNCTYGVPSFLFDDSAPERYTALRIDARSDPGYPGSGLREIGRLRLRIPDDFEGTEIRLRNAAFSLLNGPIPFTFETGGMLSQDFYSAKEFLDGVIEVTGPDHKFHRGDANGDGKVDLSDAVAVLGNLFLGNTDLHCVDAADTDDSGKVEITDAIFLLSALFLGTKTIPAPYPGCGVDPTVDRLGCGKGCQ